MIDYFGVKLDPNNFIREDGGSIFLRNVSANLRNRFVPKPRGLVSFAFCLTPSKCRDSGVGGLEVACWPLVPKFARSHPAEAVGFLGRKNLQNAFLRRGNKTVGPMS